MKLLKMATILSPSLKIPHFSFHQFNCLEQDVPYFTVRAQTQKAHCHVACVSVKKLHLNTPQRLPA